MRGGSILRWDGGKIVKGILSPSYHTGRQGQVDRETDISPQASSSAYQTHSTCISVVPKHRRDEDRQQLG